MMKRFTKQFQPQFLIAFISSIGFILATICQCPHCYSSMETGNENSIKEILNYDSPTITDLVATKDF